MLPRVVRAGAAGVWRAACRATRVGVFFFPGCRNTVLTRQKKKITNIVLFLDKRDFVACVGEASQTGWSGSGIESAAAGRHDDDEDPHEEEPFFYDKQGFEELDKCGITDEEFAKRNVCAFNVRFLTPPWDDGGEAGDGGEGGEADVPAAAAAESAGGEGGGGGGGEGGGSGIGDGGGSSRGGGDGNGDLPVMDIDS